MADDLVLVDRDGAIAMMTINRPKQLNAMNPEVFATLRAEFATLANDRSVRVVILTGSGDRAFVAGADIGSMRDMPGEEAREFMVAGHEVCAAIEGAPQVVIAAINGFALGGGLEIALACDLRIASENARLGLPEVTLGIIPGLGGTQRLARVVGKGIAKQLIFTGEQIDAAEAHRIGLVNQVVPAGQAVAAAGAMAAKIVKNGPIAIREAKRAIDLGVDTDLERGLEIELECEDRVFASNDRREGLGAFLERRPPVFEDR